jgi:hypothetical protein
MAGTLVSIATMSNVFDVAPAGSGSGAVASAGFPLEFTGAAGLMKGGGGSNRAWRVPDLESFTGSRRG